VGSCCLIVSWLQGAVVEKFWIVWIARRIIACAKARCSPLQPLQSQVAGVGCDGGVGCQAGLAQPSIMACALCDTCKSACLSVLLLTMSTVFMFVQMDGSAM
jgi:hypothetical protein